jgi:quinoprotein glucose dehydrogenase
MENGKNIFLTRADLSCQRCHLPANSKERVGPSLEGVGSRLTHEQLLQSIVKPNAILAKGFETSTFGLKDGTTLSGVVEQEEPGRILIRNSEGKQIAIEKANIEERAKGVSLMPEGLGDRLNLRDLRDLTAYLASLKVVEKAVEKEQK